MRAWIGTGLLAIGVTAVLMSGQGPARAQGGTYDERLRSLELQVAALNARVSALEGRTGGGWQGDGIRRTYTGIGETWKIRGTINRANILLLFNGTRWEVSAEDATTVGRWQLNEVVRIGVSTNKQYPYALTNIDRRQEVLARYVGTQ